MRPPPRAERSDEAIRGVSVATARLVGGVAFLAVALFSAAEAGWSLGLLVLIVGFAVGWATERWAIRYRNVPLAILGDTSGKIAANIGVVIAFVAIALLRWLNPAGLPLFIAAASGWVSGFFLSLRFSRFGKTAV